MKYQFACIYIYNIYIYIYIPVRIYCILYIYYIIYIIYIYGIYLNVVTVCLNGREGQGKPSRRRSKIPVLRFKSPHI